MIKTLILTASLSAGMILFSSPLPAGAVQSNSAGTRGMSSRVLTVYPDSNTATTIFEDVRDDAELASEHAATLQSFDSAEAPSWHSDDEQLRYLKNEINQMGESLSRLEAIRGQVAPWQVRAIDKLAVTLRLMADNANDAIRFVSSHHNDLWGATYQLYLGNLFHEASSLEQCADRAVDYAKVVRQYRDLRHDLGIKAS